MWPPDVPGYAHIILLNLCCLMQMLIVRSAQLLMMWLLIPHHRVGLLFDNHCSWKTSPAAAVFLVLTCSRLVLLHYVPQKSSRHDFQSIRISGKQQQSEQYEQP